MIRSIWTAAEDRFSDRMENYVRYRPGYPQEIVERLRLFFRGNFVTREFSNTQSFDFESLRGRLLSSSYAPAEGWPQHEPMMAELRAIFGRHQQDGRVDIDYRTMVYIGSWTPDRSGVSRFF